MSLQKGIPNPSRNQESMKQQDKPIAPTIREPKHKATGSMPAPKIKKEEVEPVREPEKAPEAPQEGQEPSKGDQTTDEQPSERTPASPEAETSGAPTMPESAMPGQDMSQANQ